MVSDVSQHAQLDERLLMEARLVADHLDRHEAPLAVVVRLDHLPKRAPTDP